MVKLRTRPQTDAGLTGTARMDRRTTALLSRLRPGDIAVLDQVDLDGPTAEAMVEAGVVAVVNRASMISGRFPNRGPQLLLDAGIRMVDQAAGPDGRELFSAVADGRRLVLRGGCLYSGEQVVAEGRELSADEVERQLAEAETGLTTQLHTLTHNSVEFLRREEALFLHGEGDAAAAHPGAGPPGRRGRAGSGRRRRAAPPAPVPARGQADHHRDR